MASGRSRCRRRGQRHQWTLVATRKGFAGTGFRANHGTGDGGTGRGAGCGFRTGLPDEPLGARTSESAAAPTRPRQLSYAGAVTALAAGAVTFVASVSLAVGIQL